MRGRSRRREEKTKLYLQGSLESRFRWRLACKHLPTLRSNTYEGRIRSQVSIRSLVVIQSQATPQGVLKLGMALQSCPELGQGDQDLMLQYRLVIGCGLLPRERVTLIKMALCSPGQCPEKAES